MPDFQPPEDYPSITYIYMTLEDFWDGVNCGVYGPDETCYWVHINDLGQLVETPIAHPFADPLPPDTIAVAYIPV